MLSLKLMYFNRKLNFGTRDNQVHHKPIVTTRIMPIKFVLAILSRYITIKILLNSS